MSSINNSGRERYWIIALAVLPVFLFFPYWLHPLAVGDNTIEFQGLYEHIFGMIRSFEDPLWNPYLISGFPESGYPSANPYNPLAWVHLISSPVVATNLQILIFYSMTGIGFYLFARTFGLGKPASFLSGTFAMAGGHALSVFSSLLALNGAAWTGWVLAALEKLRKATGVRERAKWTLLLGLAAGAQFIAGHPYPFFHTCVFAGVYTFMVGFGQEKGARKWVWFICSGCGILLAFLLNSAQILPGMELQNLSWRRILPYEMFLGVTFPPSQILGGMIFIGSVEKDLRAPFFSVLGLLLAGYGAIKNWRDMRFKAMVFIAFGAVVLMLGEITPLPRLLYHVPILNLMGSFRRYRVEFSAGVCIMAGAGLEYLLAKESWHLRRWIVAFVVISVVGFLMSYLRPPLLMWAIPFGLSLSALSLFFLHLRMVTKRNVWLALALAAFLIQSGWFLHAFLKDDANLVDPTRPAAILKYVPHAEKGGEPPERVLPVVDLRQFSMNFYLDMGAQNLSVLQGIHNAAGLQPVMLDRYSRLLSMDFMGFPGILRDLVDPKKPVLDILNIKHIVIPKIYLKNRFWRLWSFPDPVNIEGVPFLEECYMELLPGDQLTFRTPETETSGIGLVTGFSGSSEISQGTDVLKVTLAENEKSSREIILKAGVDTAEAAYDIINLPAEKTFEFEGIPFFKPVNLVMHASSHKRFSFSGIRAKAIYMISFLFMAQDIPQGTEVATLTVYTNHATPLKFPIRAGVETSELSIDEMRNEVRHSKTTVASAYKTPEGNTVYTYFTPFVFDRSQEVMGVEINVDPKVGESGLYLNYMTLMGPDGQFSGAALQPKPMHNIVRIFPEPGQTQYQGPKYHLYYTIKKLSSPLVAKWCTVKNVMPSGQLAIRAITLTNFKDNSSVPLTYIDHYLGDPKNYDVEENDDVKIWHRKKDSPRAWLASSAISLWPHEILAAIRTGRLPDGTEFDPWNVALIDRDRPPVLLSNAKTNGQVVFKHYSPNEVSLRAQCDNRCMLILSEVFYPGWTATVDGIPTMVYSVDYVLRGVVVELGEHEIVFRYRPASVHNGRLISGLTLIFMALAVLFIRLRFPKHGANET